MVSHGADKAPAFSLDELENAVRYQRWVLSAVRPFLGTRIIEVGSGTGNMSRWLPVRDRLVLTEPDPALFKLLQARAVDLRFDTEKVQIEDFNPVVDSIERYAHLKLDTAVSFNVLEHIPDDQLVLERLVRLLDAGGSTGARRIVAFVPAHPWAYGSLDAAFEHRRRYTAAGLAALLSEVAPRARVSVRHFNLPGLPGWIIAGRILRRSTIPPASIRAFEFLCPFIRPIDDFVHRRLHIPFGQSLIGVAEWTP